MAAEVSSRGFKTKRLWQGVFCKAPRPAWLWLALASVLLLLPVRQAAAATFGLRHCPTCLGDPYLETNAAGVIAIVLNSNIFETNAVYRGKVNMLLGLEAQDTQGQWSTLTEATKKSNLARLMAAELLPDSLREALGLPNADFARRALNMPVTTPANAHFTASSSSARLAQDDDNPLPFFLQRWVLFVGVTIFLVRRIWRYFLEVDDDDDFADHLSSMAQAHRWVFPVYLLLLLAVAALEFGQIGNLFFSVSILMLAGSVRRYYCEGDFAGYPLAQKIHFGLSLLLIWLSWQLARDNYLADVTTLLNPRILGWVLLAAAIKTFSLFYNDEDYANHRSTLYWFAAGFLVLALLGSAGGYGLWCKLSVKTSPWVFIGLGAVFACLPLAGYFRYWIQQMDQEIGGRKLFDFIFLERKFAEKTKRQQRLPHLMLLQHWRQHGHVNKAWKTAKAYLVKEPRALPIWLFALETAIVHRHQPEAARKILKELCASEKFNFDHRTAAVSQVEGWMQAAGYAFDRSQFAIERPQLQPAALMSQVEEKCRAGKVNEAAKLLKAILTHDTLNETAFILLVRLYAQDLKKPAAARRMIAEGRETFGPNLLEFLENSVDEWARLPSRRNARSTGWLGRWFNRNQRGSEPQKITLKFNPAPAEPKKPDPIEAYLERLKQACPEPSPMPDQPQDSLEKMLHERRFGTAIEQLKEQAEAQPKDFGRWLRYAEAYGNHCGEVSTAEKIIQQMERSGNFTKAEIKDAYVSLSHWRKKHPRRNFSW